MEEKDLDEKLKKMLAQHYPDQKEVIKSSKKKTRKKVSELSQEEVHDLFRLSATEYAEKYGLTIAGVKDRKMRVEKFFGPQAQTVAGSQIVIETDDGEVSISLPVRLVVRGIKFR